MGGNIGGHAVLVRPSQKGQGVYDELPGVGHGTDRNRDTGRRGTKGRRHPYCMSRII